MAQKSSSGLSSANSAIVLTTERCRSTGRVYHTRANLPSSAGVRSDTSTKSAAGGLADPSASASRKLSKDMGRTLTLGSYYYLAAPILAIGGAGAGDGYASGSEQVKYNITHSVNSYGRGQNLKKARSG